MLGLTQKFGASTNGEVTFQSEGRERTQHQQHALRASSPRDGGIDRTTTEKLYDCFTARVGGGEGGGSGGSGGGSGERFDDGDSGGAVVVGGGGSDVIGGGGGIGSLSDVVVVVLHFLLVWRFC
ncbi:hypothetical protein FHG87_012180 [Trinorchestia longiramus]|nr:hypothetical protein FHG87_012180 [Trinorchestia longiramus]